MANENLFSGIGKDFLTYLGVSRVFPEIEEIISMERNLKLVNVQVSRGITNINRFSTEGRKAFTSINNLTSVFNKNLSETEARTLALTDAIDSQAIMFGVSRDTMVTLMQSTAEYGRLLSSETVGALTMFQEATDVSTYALGDFTARMLASRRLEEGETKKYLESILNVREQYGLATDDLYRLFNITEKYANMVGVTGERLRSSTAEIAKFISVLKQAGLEADFATDILERMFDPTRAQESMVLLSKLGISMRDISFGDPMESLEEVLPKFKEVAEGILSHSGRITQAKMAEVFGLTLEQVNKISNLEINRTEIAREKSLEAFRKETMSALESLEDVKNRIVGAISFAFNHTIGLFTKRFPLLMTPVMIYLGMSILKGLGGSIKKLVGNIFGDDFRASLTDTISKGTSQGIMEGLLASESRLAEHFQKTSGLGPRSQQSDIEILDRTIEKIQGGSTARASFTSAKIGAEEARAGRFSRDTEDNIGKYFEESTRRILDWEANIVDLESMKFTGARESLRKKTIEELKALSENETVRLGGLLRSEKYRNILGERIREKTEELSGLEEERLYLDAAEKKLKTYIKDIQVKIGSASDEEVGTLLESLEIANTSLANAQKRLAEVKVAKGASERMTVLSNVMGGSGVINPEISDDVIASEYLRWKPSTSSTTREKVSKATLNMDRSMSRVLGFLPGMGGTLGRIVGTLGTGGTIGAAITVVTGIGMGIFSLAKKGAEKNEKTLEHQKIISDSLKETKETIENKVAKPLGAIYSKSAEIVAGVIGKNQERTNLEEMTIASITSAKTNDGRVLAVLEKIGSSVAVSAEIADIMERQQRARFGFEARQGRG